VVPGAQRSTVTYHREQPTDRIAPATPEPWILPRLRGTNSRDRRSPGALADRKLKKVRDDAHREAQERRARVIKHEDLRKALKAAGFKAECWNGYVPPRLDAYGRINDAQERADLVAICAEALRRERAAA
jgi:hypothetical protein